jgi:hypothetical protein
VDAGLDTLATALHVRIDDELKTRPELGRWRPSVGLCPRLSGAELITMAVIQALLGFSSKTQFLRFARSKLAHPFPCAPKQPGYSKRLRAAAGQLRVLIRVLAQDTDLWEDDAWMAGSTPVECGRSGRPPSAPSSWALPATATAPATRATSGACVCTWSRAPSVPRL